MRCSFTSQSTGRDAGTRKEDHGRIWPPQATTPLSAEGPCPAVMDDGDRSAFFGTWCRFLGREKTHPLAFTFRRLFSEHHFSNKRTKNSPNEI
ncbi:unnamed protein product [Arctia plantaginis]|uniref:Uncharacterized protein n=1 Tax=Arctia plantaginis TaxID=874455 RepID=A0A8S0YZP2_ARCPL|nr:unnamed protein product [Arctia plantaginis]